MQGKPLLTQPSSEHCEGEISPHCVDAHCDRSRIGCLSMPLPASALPRLVQSPFSPGAPAALTVPLFLAAQSQWQAELRQSWLVATPQHSRSLL